MAITVKVIKAGYGHKPGQVLTLNEFDAGHLMGFGFAVPYVEPKVETQMVAPNEIRVLPIETPVKFFKRRGRRKKE